MAVVAMLAATTTAYLPGVTMSLPQLSASPRHRALQMGFEIEDVTEKAVGEMGVFGWPGLAKQSADFSQSAAADELLMVYVKEGKGTISDGEETATVAAGQMVMISDGSVQWWMREGGASVASAPAKLRKIRLGFSIAWDFRERPRFAAMSGCQGRHDAAVEVGEAECVCV